MVRATKSDLQRKIALLQAENAALRALTPKNTTHAADAVDAVDAAPEPRDFRARTWAWTVLATVLIVLGSLLAPVAVVAAWANVQLTDTDRFVAAYAPLAREPAVQSFVTAEVTAIVNDQIDLGSITGDVIDGIISLGTPPLASQALQLLHRPAVSALQNLIETSVAGFVASDAFANTWTAALRVSHAQLVGAVAHDADSALIIGPEGTIGIQLGPVVAAAKAALLDQGLGFASVIPEVDRTIAIAQSDALPTIQVIYALAVAAGIWLPWVALGLVAAGVLVARRRMVALVAASIGLGAVLAGVLIALGVARTVWLASQVTIPTDTAGVLFDNLFGAMRDMSIALLVVVIVVAIVAWFAGPFALPIRLRRAAGSGVAKLRSARERRGAMLT